jgi:AAHS family 4-hydroxybenzoate transporter-like MFS transporter
MPIAISELLDHGPWPRFAKLVTLLCALAIIFDGFDISIVGFAIPSILKDWHLPRGSFAPLLVIGLVGMTVGSMSAGFVGDRIGRRFALSLSVLFFGIAIVASSFAPNLQTIEILRFIAAAGIGGALPNAATMSAEFTPVKMRTIAVMITIVCVPLGGALAGSVAAAVLPVGGWRALFFIGGAAPILLSIAMFVLIPESPHFLSRHPHRASELVKLLGRLQHTVPANSTFIEIKAVDNRAGQKIALQDFFGGAQTRSTLSLWLAFFSSGASVYMCFSWLPSLLSAGGLDLAGASQGLAAYNYGGVVGVLCFVSLVNRFGSRILTLVASSLAVATALLLMAIAIKPSGSQIPLLTALAAHGFCVNAVQTSLFALGVHLYPTRVRASGVAVGSAIGRVGAILSASVGSMLIQVGRVQFFEFLTIAMFVAFIGLSLLHNHIPSFGAKRILTTAA